MTSSHRSKLTRRGFLGAGIASLTAPLLAACNLPTRTNPNTDPILITATPDIRASIPYTLGTTPDIGGIISAMGNGEITLQGASGTSTLPIDLDGAVLPPVRRPDGVALATGILAVGSNVAVYLDGQNIVRSVVLLPTFTPLGPTLGAPAQAEPTGETRVIGPLTMITRAGWGAAEPDLMAFAEYGVFDAMENPEGWLEYPAPLADWLDSIIIHHTALAFPEGPRTIQSTHQGTRGFADISYHFLIDSLGTLFEGRSLNVRGAHTGGANTGTIGIALIGNYEDCPPLRRPLDTLITLARTLIADYTITHLAGHRDFQPGETQCPGDNLEALMPDLAAQLGLIYGTGGYVDPPWVGP